MSVNEFEFIKVDLKNGVGRLTLNRPEKRNALKRSFISEIQQGLDQLKSNENLRVLIIAAEGDVFCAGMDLGEMQERAQADDGKVQWQRDSEVYADVVTTILELSVPTIAAVSGPALAGGMGIVLACDLLIASDNTFFMLPEPMRGITAAMVTPLLIHRIGAGPANYLLLSGEKLAAEKALSMNLCHDVVPRDQFDCRVDSLAASILTGSQNALAITKDHIKHCSGSDLIEQIKLSTAVSAQARETDDAREGLAAFLEKRKPSWQPNN